jgi:glycosyltransferase involved in cell wall biosynthesis
MKILVVSLQFPFPPRTGGSQRVYQLLRQIAARHDVTLLSYARPDEQESVDALRRELPVEIVPRDRPSQWARRAVQLRSIVSRQPFSAHEYYSPALQHALDDLCTRESFDLVQLEGALLCGLDLPPDVRVILDGHNIDYEVFQRMRETERSFVRRSFHRLEYLRFRRFEERAWTQVDGCTVTSDREEPIVRAAAPRTPTAVVPNGVDLEYFSPSSDPVVPRTLVFNGTLEYRPNLDAAYHLVQEIWPLVRDRCPDAELAIVGRAAEADIRRLRRDGVLVTGEVPDIRPYLQRAAVVGVPVRMGGGTRLKVVEGLAMGKAMVSTTLGCEGVRVEDGEHLLIGDDAEAFAARVVELFDDHAGRERLGIAARGLVEREYGWDLAAERLEELYRRVAPAPPHRASNVVLFPGVPDRERDLHPSSGRA